MAVTPALQQRIDALPPIARQDLLDDLAGGQEPDADLDIALDFTLKAYERTGLDGEALYAVVNKDVAKAYNVPVTLLDALTL